MININCFENLTDGQISLVEMIAIFVMNDLDLHHDITININTLDEMDNSVGVCYSPDEFDIFYENNIDSLFKAIAHELRHVSQRYHNVLTDDRKWFGKEYDCSYDELPWELDAHKYEETIFNKMKSYKG